MLFVKKTHHFWAKNSQRNRGVATEHFRAQNSQVATGAPTFQPSVAWKKGFSSGHTLWLCQNSYWKWPFIVDFPVKNGDFP